MKRTRKKSSMPNDTGSKHTWVWGWGGKVNAMNSRIRRRVRKRQAEREIRDA
jgi:hypothetical protein